MSALSRRDENGAEKRRATIALSIRNTPNSPSLKKNQHLKTVPIIDSDFQLFSDLTKPDVQKEGKKLNSDLVKSLPIKKLKNAIKKDNQNEVLETNFVPLSGKLKLFRKLIFSIKKNAKFYQAKF